MAPRFKALPERTTYQSQLFPANVFDLLPEDHECFLYQELFEQLDTSEVEAQYSDRGQRAYAPRQIVSILIYAYSRGVFSSRQIEQRCREDLGFMYIAGRNCPNFRGVERFPEGPRGILPVLLQADGATGDGAGAGEFGTRQSWTAPSSRRTAPSTRR